MKILDDLSCINNICNTPEIATIRLHHNQYGNGEYFLRYITYVGLKTDGRWIDGLLTKDEVKTIISILKRSNYRLKREKKKNG